MEETEEQKLERALDAAEVVSCVWHRRNGVYKVELRGVATNYVVVSATAIASTLHAATLEAAGHLACIVEAPPRLDLRPCKACGANCVWARTATGKAMPVNHVPGPDGNVSLARTPQGELVASVLSADEAKSRGRTLFTSHFATCPHAAVMRKS